MQQTAPNSASNNGESAFQNWSSPSFSSASFAGLLASLTSPEHATSAESDDNDLTDDVATLSYADALRTHVRYKPTPREDGIASPAVRAQTCSTCGAPRNNSDHPIHGESHSLVPGWQDDPELNSTVHPNTRVNDSKKCASITIRMSKDECEQLKKRAAEAGLTISAYLRSCTFEAEALRAEVKKTLADLKKTSPSQRSEPPAEIEHSRLVGRSLIDWLMRLMTPWHARQRIARA